MEHYHSGREVVRRDNVLPLLAVAVQYGMAGLKRSCKVWLSNELPQDIDLLEALLAWCSEYPNLGKHVLHVAVGVILSEFGRLMGEGHAADLLTRWQALLLKPLVSEIKRRLVALMAALVG